MVRQVAGVSPIEIDPDNAIDGDELMMMPMTVCVHICVRVLEQVIFLEI